MEQQGHNQAHTMVIDPNTGQLSYGASLYPPPHLVSPPSYVSMVGGEVQPPSQPTGVQLAQHQLAYQQIHQQQQQQLQTFWSNQYQEIEKVTEFKNHSLPLARIKKIMKADEDVRMISAEAPIVFARACEIFILELTLRSWNHTEENKRRTLQKNDTAAAITRTDIFDFLVDIVPMEDLKDEAVVVGDVPRRPVGPGDALSYCYVQPQPGVPQVGNPGVFLGKPVMDPTMYGQHYGHPYMGQTLCPETSEQPQSPPDH